MLATMLGMRAQTDDEYLMEVGGGLGIMGYLGDYNNMLTRDLQPMMTVFVRRNLNAYMALRLDASIGTLKGNERDVRTVYPSSSASPYHFSNKLTDVSLMYEYNFWPYGTGREYRGAQRLTPFVFGGLGATYVQIKNGAKKSAFSANVPIGIGVKYKLGERTNIGLEWAMHFCLSDELDGQKDPYDIKSNGAFKNTDCYSTLQLTVTYSFMAKCRTCHNEDE